jgi:serine/threonine-protein kinase
MQKLATPVTGGQKGEPRLVGGSLSGWAIERALSPGPTCRSWLVTKGGQRAVVRVLRQRLAVDRRAREQWLRASWAPNRFHHARVIRVIEQGSDERGTPVVVREWAEGQALQEKVDCAPLDPAFALRLAAQLLDALEMAHAHGIVHGALTPSNVVVTSRGSVRLVDFATSPWLLGRDAGSHDLLASARLGPFTAPEQRNARRWAPGEPSDVWSVGACLYFSLVGRPPTAPFEETQLARAAGADVAAVVGYSLSRDPLARYESAYAMLGDVRRLLAGRKPKLDGSVTPLSQNVSQRDDPNAIRTPSSTTSRIFRPIGPPPAQHLPGEWRGNVLLMIAISLLVGLASFVLVRERLADVSCVAQPQSW